MGGSNSPSKSWIWIPVSILNSDSRGQWRVRRVRWDGEVAKPERFRERRVGGRSVMRVDISSALSSWGTSSPGALQRRWRVWSWLKIPGFERMNFWIEDRAKEGFIVVIRERNLVVGWRPGSASARKTLDVVKSRSWIRGIVSSRDLTTVVVSTSLDRMTIF